VKRPRLSIIIGLMIFTMLLAVSVRAQTLPADLNQSIHLNVECHSGTPLVLEFVLKAPEDMVRSVSFDFESDGEYDLSISRPTEEVIFRGVPFRKAGTYRTTAYVHTKEGNFTREYIIAYTEFVWGRDNFQFANDGKFEDSGDFVSDTLIEWAENQFGQLSQDEKVLLLSIMYDIYKGSIGRCYGFTGEQIYYITHPGNIPEQYGSIYWMREEDRTIFRNMDYIQNDIVFSNLLSGKISVQEQQNRDDLMRELDVIKESIGEGEPIIIGYLSNLMHHSMVVYGYFEDLFRGTVTLLTANNWEREQNNNTFSEDNKRFNKIFQILSPTIVFLVAPIENFLGDSSPISFNENLVAVIIPCFDSLTPGPHDEIDTLFDRLVIPHGRFLGVLVDTYHFITVKKLAS